MTKGPNTVNEDDVQALKELVEAWKETMPRLEREPFRISDTTQMMEACYVDCADQLQEVINSLETKHAND